jgi:hypothetical protein
MNWTLILDKQAFERWKDTKFVVGMPRTYPCLAASVEKWVSFGSAPEPMAIFVYPDDAAKLIQMAVEVANQQLRAFAAREANSGIQGPRVITGSRP